MRPNNNYELVTDNDATIDSSTFVNMSISVGNHFKEN